MKKLFFLLFAGGCSTTLLAQADSVTIGVIPKGAKVEIATNDGVIQTLRKDQSFQLLGRTDAGTAQLLLLDEGKLVNVKDYDKSVVSYTVAFKDSTRTPTGPPRPIPTIITPLTTPSTSGTNPPPPVRFRVVDNLEHAQLLKDNGITKEKIAEGLKRIRM